MILEGTDNLLTGSLFYGSVTGEGIESAGANSAFIRSVGYKGFLSASNATGVNSGFMMFSGSVLPDESDDYKGVGLEMVANSASYFRFRTNPSELDIRADAFFVGNPDAQFVSGSGGNIEISSSNFHLSSSGDVVMQGKITATAGDIGGFLVEDGKLTAGTNENSVTMSGEDLIIAMGSGSTFNKSGMLGGLRMGLDTDGEFKFALGSAASYIHFDSTGVSIKSDSFDVTASVAEINVDTFLLESNNLVISSSGDQFIAAGATVPTGVDGTNKGFYVAGSDSQMLIGNAAGGHFIFDGTNVSISSSAFYFGNNEQYISGSLGNIEISSSNFHLQADGDVIMSGTVTATAGIIGGLTIGDTKLSSGTAYEISSSTNVADPVSFISSSNFKVSAGGQVTASALRLSTGEVGGLGVIDTEISVGDILKLKDSGQITGSEVLFTGGTIGGFTIDADEIKSGTTLILDADSNSGEIKLGAASDINTGDGIYMNGTGNAFRVGNPSGNEFKFDGTSVYIGNDGAEHVKIDGTSLLFIDNSTTMAELRGTTWTLGGAHGATDDAIVMSPDSGVTIFDSSTDKAVVSSLGLDITQNNVNVARFAAITRIGDVANDHVSMSSAGFSIKDGTTQLSTFNAGGAIIGKANVAHISASSLEVNVIKDSDNKAVLGSLGLDVTQGGTNIARFGAITRIGDVANEHISMSAAGMTIKDGTTQLSTFNAGGAIIGKTNEAHISASSLEVNVIKDSNNKAVINSSGLNVTQGGNVVGVFGATTTIGINGTTAEHAILDGTGLTIKDGSTVRASLLNTAITLNGASTADRVVIDEDGMEIYTADVLKASAADAGFTAFGDDVNTKAVMSSAGMTVFNDGTVADPGTGVSHFGANLRIGAIADNTSRLQIDTDGNLKIINRQGTTDTTTIELKTTGAAEFAGKVTAESGEIGGFTIASTQISSDNLIISSNGTLETADYASDSKGWRISSLDNGMAEFENAKIRGTLSTAVFEKETVNAVGGQLYIANSSALTGSGMISASFTTMSVVNATGFTGSYGGDGEILSLKKVTSTGFSTEYVKIQSSSRDIPSSDTNFAGQLYVVRGYSGSAGVTAASAENSSSIGEAAGSAQSYQPGQVIVSTGRVGTGFIRLNANPNDHTTPYMDIAERTGSAVYDVDLKVRLGDLSGLSAARVGADPGFGLFTERAFLTKDVTVGTLATEHIVIDATSLVFKDGTTSMAELRGTTWTLGGAHGATDDAIVMSPTNGVTIFDSNTNKTTITSDGLKVFGGHASNPVAVFAATTFIGLQATEHIKITASSMELKDGATVLASFGATTTIGEADDRITLTSSGLVLREGGNDRITMASDGITIGKDGEARTVIDDTSISMYSGQAAPRKRVAIDNTGVAAFGGALGADVSTTSTDDVVRITPGAGVAIYEDSNNFASMSAVGLDVTQGGTNIARFGAITRIGDVANDHVSMSSAGFSVKDGTTQLSTFNAGGAIIGKTNEAHISASSLEVSVIKDSNNKAVLGSLGLDITQGGTNVARFAAVTRLGDVANEHISMSAAGMTIKDGTTVLANFAADVTIGEVASNKRNVFIDENVGIKIRNNTTDIASFGDDITLVGGTLTLQSNADGGGNDDRVVIGNANIEMYTDDSKVVDIADGKISIGPAANAGVSNGAVIGNIHLASGGAFIYGAATDDFVNVKSDAVDVVAAGVTEASFGATTVIGAVADNTSRIVLGSGKVQIINRQGTTDTTVIELDDAGDATFTGNVTATAGAIGGFTIANNQLSGSSTALIATNVGADRIEIRGSDNTIAFFEGTKSSSKILDMGKFSSVQYNSSSDRINSYGLSVSGSVTAFGNNKAGIRVTNPDIAEGINFGAVTEFYQSTHTNIFSRISLGTRTDVMHGRPAIYGEVNSQLASDVGTGGIISGVTGRIIEGTSGRWDISAGVVGISSAEAMTSDGGGVADGVFGVASIGDAYVKGDLTATGTITGDVTGDVTGNADTATNATNVAVTATAGNSTHRLVFSTADSGNSAMLIDGTDAGLSFNPFSNAFTIGGTTTIGGGYGSTGITLESDGDLSMNGDLVVDGHFTGGGTRGYFFFGESSNYTATRYLDMAQGHLANSTDGILMGRAGSITGITVNYNINSVTLAQNIGFGAPPSSGTFGVLVDGTAVFTTAATYSSTGAKNAKSTQAIGVDTFSAGDVIQANNTITNVTAGGAASAVTVGDVTLYVEVTFDS